MSKSNHHTIYKADCFVPRSDGKKTTANHYRTATVITATRPCQVEAIRSCHNKGYLFQKHNEPISISKSNHRTTHKADCFVPRSDV